MESRNTLATNLSASRIARNVVHNAAFQDKAVLAFHAYMSLRVAMAPESADRSFAFRFAFALFAVSTIAIALSRGEVLRPGKLRSLVYRIGIFAPVPLSYFSLRTLLPALQPELLDLQLWSIDEAIFGTTPALWLNQFNQPGIIEWFSFFYYSYFYLMVGMLIPPLFFDKGRRLRELMVGGMTVAIIGHIGYTLVPGAGPVSVLQNIEPIHGGFFWQQVVVTVESAGAQLDIFPSLHTAYPAFFALHAFGWRKTKPHRFLWPVVAFMSLNIMVATMLLRWHWGIDVMAGLCLAFSARALAVYVSRRETDEEREEQEKQPVWEPLLFS